MKTEIKIEINIMGLIVKGYSEEFNHRLKYYFDLREHAKKHLNKMNNSEISSALFRVSLSILLFFFSAFCFEIHCQSDRSFGLTIDDVSSETIILQQLRRFKVEAKNGNIPIVRIVFDVYKNNKPLIVQPEYKSIIQKIKQENLALVMGELLDSQIVYACRDQSLPFKNCYLQRTANFFQELDKNESGKLVDIWEIGNEVNGEWVGWKNEKEWKDDDITVQKMLERRAEVADAVAAANAYIKSKGGRTALTLYFNQDIDGNHSWEDGVKKTSRKDKNSITYGENYGMFNWWNAFKGKFKDKPTDDFPNIDYLLVSYWQDDNFNVLPGKWVDIFSQLNKDLPTAKLGFGEVGVQCYTNCGMHGKNVCEAPKDGKRVIDYQKRRCLCCLQSQDIYIKRYYAEWDRDIRRMISDSENENFRNKFIGGYFYWQFNDDVLNKFFNADKHSTKQSEGDALKAEAEETLQSLLSTYIQWQK